MSDTKLEIDLDPKKVLDGLKEMASGSKLLAEDMEKALKLIEGNFDKLGKKAEDSANKVDGTFRNLGTRMKEDLKNLLDLGKIMGAIGMADQIKQGVTQIFTMEQSFARLNTRLGLSGKELTNFKNSFGRAAAEAGIDAEKLFPGIETMSAKGGVKDAGQLGAIADVLAKTSTVTQEDTGSLSDSIIGILKDQGKQVTAQSVKETADALAATRVSGAFKTSAEAGNAIARLTSMLDPKLKDVQSMQLGTRELGAMSAMASRGGERGMDIMQSILKTASGAGGKSIINGVLGAAIFDKTGKMDVAAFNKVSPEAWGRYTSQGRGAALGVNNADLSRFVTSMQQNQSVFGGVTGGKDEVNKQFKSIDTMSQKFNTFTGKVTENAREFGGGIMDSAKSLFNGDTKGAWEGVKNSFGAKYGKEGQVGVGSTILATGAGLSGTAGAAAAMGIGGTAAAATAGVPLMALGGGILMGMAKEKMAEKYPEASFAAAAASSDAGLMIKSLEVLFSKYFGNKEPQQMINKSSVQGTGAAVGG